MHTEFDQIMVIVVGAPILICIVLFLVGVAMLWDRFFAAHDAENSVTPAWAGILFVVSSVMLGIYLWKDYLPGMYRVYTG